MVDANLIGVDSIAQLRAQRPPKKREEVVAVLAITTPPTFFYYDHDSSTADDGATVIKPADEFVLTSEKGRWTKS